MNMTRPSCDPIGLRMNMTRWRSGFSLIEMVGVLAVMSMLAALIVPNVIRRVAEARGTKEELNLDKLSTGLVEHVKTRQSVPGGASWVSTLAGLTGLSQTEIQRVDPNDTNSLRVFLIHPSFTPSSGFDPVSTNKVNGLVAPTNALVMFISSTKTTLPIPVASGKASDTTSNRAAFENIWNWTFNPVTKAAPSGWPAQWTGQGEHLRVSRINLAPWLHHVTYSNLQFPTNIPFARINGLSTRAFDVTNAEDGWYWEGTVVRLYKHDSPYGGAPANPDELDMVHTLVSDLNLIYTGAPSGWAVP